jgi:hypothetical protein
MILRYTIAHLQEKINTLCICFIYPNTVPVQFMNSVFTDDSSILSLWVSAYGRFEWLQCLYLPQSNCLLKLSQHDRYDIPGIANHRTAHRHIPEVCALRKTAVRTEHSTTGGNICRYLVTMSSAPRRTAQHICLHFVVCSR